MQHSPKRQNLPIGTRVAYLIYQIALHLALPFGFMLAAWRARKEPAHLKHLSHRFGLGPVGPPGAIWIYAASLGEMNAARPLVQKFLEGGHHVLLTHLSPAGLDRGKALFGDDPKVSHRYMPLDSFFLVQLFLRRAKPACGIVLEIEVWPAMMIESDRCKIPMFLANGNLLEKRMYRLGTFKRHGLFMYRLFDHIFTRAQDYVDRYVRVGVDPKSVSITGELRFDTPPNIDLLSQGQALRKTWNTPFTFMIASSIKDEEAKLMPIVQDLLTQVPHAKIIWVPRSPQRFDPLFEQLQKAGFQTQRRSEIKDTIHAQTQVFLGDSLGEMDMYLGMADIVFVGASFVPMGGHNIIEPLSAGCPVIMGPSSEGVDFAANPAKAAGVFERFDTPADMTRHLIHWAKTPKDLDQMRAKTKIYAAKNSQAAENCVQGILHHMGT